MIRKQDKSGIDTNESKVTTTMNVLYLTHNAALRSTTCALDALFTQDEGRMVTPTIVFSKCGPWQAELKERGITTYTREFVPSDLKHPITTIKQVAYWLNLIKKHNINLIHVNEHDNYPVIRFVARLTQIPVVVFVRFVLEGGFGRWAFKGQYAPARVLFTSKDQLNRSRSDLPTEIPEDHIRLFGNGRALDKLVSGESHREKSRAMWDVEPEQILLGTASVIRRRKRLEDFINLIERLVCNGYSVKGVIAGGGEYADPAYYRELEQLVISKGLAKRIKMLGNLDDIKPFYNAIDVFISTSGLETFGLSVCEAMAFALPVVAYEGGAVQEVLNDPRGIVPNCDLDQLFRKTEALLKDNFLARDMGEKARERAFDLYNAPKLAKRLIQIYKELV